MALLIAAGGIAASTLLFGATGKMIALSIAGFGIFAVLPVFWTLPTTFLSGTAAAGGIAVVNSVGNLSGFVGPYVMGELKDATGSFTVGLLAVAAAGLVGMVLALSLQHDQRLERAPDEAAEVPAGRLPERMPAE